MSSCFKHSSRRFLAALFALVISLGVGRIALAQQEESPASTNGKISGRVVNENGEPIAKATVSFFATGARPRSTTTDETGYFEVSDLDPFVYSITASSPSYYLAPRDPDSTQPYAFHIGDSANFRLLKGGVITGTVTSATGEPLVQAGVRALMIRDANGKPPTSMRYPTDRQTDDRGVYRIYGLAAGTYLVSAGGRGTYGYNANAYDSEAPTFAPSSTRDTATEVVVQAGEEIGGIDIRLRGETGHAISGSVIGGLSERSSTNVVLQQVFNGLPQVTAVTFQPNVRGFAFYGLADGEYDVVAQAFSETETLSSEPVHVTLKGKNVSGLNIALKSLGAIGGKLILATSAIEGCKNKRQPLLSETMLTARINRQNYRPSPTSFAGSQAIPDKSGEFTMRNLGPGQFSLNAVFFAKYWYLRSIKRPKTATTKSEIDVARDGLTLKYGERINDLTITLAEGVASLRGSVKLPEGAGVPPRLYVHLVPAEKESAEDVLRFFTLAITSDGTFAFNNLPPGKYWALARLSPDNEPQYDSKLRAPDGSSQRAQVRRSAEAAKSEMELKPCQNVADYAVPFEIATPKN